MFSQLDTCILSYIPIRNGCVLRTALVMLSCLEFYHIRLELNCNIERPWSIQSPLRRRSKVQLVPIQVQSPGLKLATLIAQLADCTTQSEFSCFAAESNEYSIYREIEPTLAPL